LGLSFSKVPIVGPFFPLVFSVVLGYLGWSVGVKNKEDILAVFSALPRLGKDKQLPALISDSNKILDTSVIIDGRIADICKSGFVDGTLIIPGFVLEELRHIADSSDLLKRNRGRRGLDILNKIRKELDVKVRIVEEDFPDIEEVSFIYPWNIAKPFYFFKIKICPEKFCYCSVIVPYICRDFRIFVVGNKIINISEISPCPPGTECGYKSSILNKCRNRLNSEIIRHSIKICTSAR
jgi:hypothetical protein